MLQVKMVEILNLKKMKFESWKMKDKIFESHTN